MVQELVKKLEKNELKICIVGVGYVGYPLALAFSKYYHVIGFDINSSRVRELNEKHQSENLGFTTNEKLIKKANVIIVCVPTPVKKSKEPDLSPVKSASSTVGRNLSTGSVIVLESTYYPGVTEEFSVPIIEKESGLTCGKDFWIGYSPERVNPGDEKNTLSTITKIVGGMDKETTAFLANLYGKITKVYQVSNIKTAEAAKVIENIQRDLNIALMNELAIIMHKLELDTDEVLDAAATKWNFHRYSPGLVGGHCIPVDPYYLVYKAKELGYHPQVILAGRSINDNMPRYVVDMTVKGLISSNKLVKNSKVLIKGLTYKENVPDTRESPSVEIIHLLKEYCVDIYAHDPYVSDDQVKKYGANPFHNGDEKMDCIIFAVKHREYVEYTKKDIFDRMHPMPVIIDVKGMYKDNQEILEMGYYAKL
jgi:UDPglucose 6-dehydrogenase/UDP-N-acetyl-D-galactosamine dehydrogenase